MSLTSHRFHSHETLVRAQSWLEQLGFPSDHIEVSSTGLPTLTVQTEFSRMPVVEMILNAAELTDAQGWPAYDEFANPETIRLHVGAEPVGPDRAQTEPIGWHPVN